MEDVPLPEDDNVEGDMMVMALPVCAGLIGNRAGGWGQTTGARVKEGQKHGLRTRQGCLRPTTPSHPASHCSLLPFAPRPFESG